ncbi:MAG: hypothetical protein LBS90_05580 [Oscillospiraceae bacterium]|jgi:hypothetical protein|nr:hypothetical protein [Oscillospiraceae bacterium]
MKRLLAALLCAALALSLLTAFVFAAAPDDAAKTEQSGGDSASGGSGGKAADEPGTQPSEAAADNPADGEAAPDEANAPAADGAQPGSPDEQTGGAEENAPDTSGTTGGENYFAAARDARQPDRTVGDVVMLAETAEVSKGAGGDVFALGRGVLVSDSEKLDNIVAAGASVDVRVKTARNAYVSGADVRVNASEKIAGVYAAGLSVTLGGEIGDAVVAARTVRIDGNISGDLTLRSPNVSFAGDTTVGGEITIYSKRKPALPPSIDPSHVTYKSPASFGKTASGTLAKASGIPRLALIAAASGVVAAIAVSLIMNALRGGFYRDKARDFKRRFWIDILRGLAALVAVPVVAVALMFTVAGVPLGILGFAIYAAAVYLAPIAAGLILGRVIFRRMNRFASGAICVGILKVLTFIPYAGWIIGLAAVLYGFGAFVSGIRLRRSEAAPAHA